MTTIRTTIVDEARPFYQRVGIVGDTLLEMIGAASIPPAKVGLVADVICKRLGIERDAPIADALKDSIARQLLAARSSRLLALTVQPENNGAEQKQVDAEQQLVKTDVPTNGAVKQEGEAEHGTHLSPEIAGILSLPG
jgi:hypothetical protein